MSKFQAGDTIKARHSLWEAELDVCAEPNRLRHSLHHSLASFSVAGEFLWINWDEYDPELFVRNGDEYRQVSSKNAGDIPAAARSTEALDLYARPMATVGNLSLEVDAVSLKLPNGQGSVLVRPGTSDVPVFEATFLANEYDCSFLQHDCDLIVDLGANIGLSSVYFANLYPDAKVIAIEPSRDNFPMLLSNIQHRPAITAIQAGIWSTNGVIYLEDKTESGQHMQPWAHRTVATKSVHASYPVEALNLPTLMQRYGIGEIDLLKIDIEGAEYNLFSAGTEHWLPAVKAIVIETHERFCPGVDALIDQVLKDAFIEFSPIGENRRFVRRHGPR